MSFSSVQFNHKSDAEFAKELRTRINRYFKDNNISRHANSKMVLKTITLILMYFTPYFLVLFNVFPSASYNLLLWIMMGIGMAGIGFSIMHDANHGSYSKNQKVNKYLGYIINFVGGSSLNWKIQHNVLHHTYTNIHEVDEDIESGGLMRFSFHQKRRKFHRFQFIYAWFLYGLITISWLFKKDFLQLRRYNKMGLLKAQGTTYKRAYTRLVFAKLFYIIYMIVLPISLSNQKWWVTLLFFAVMHYICGLIISTIFQAAHVTAETAFPIAEDGKIKDNFMVHQLKTTANFAKNNKLLSWYVGGLNYQIEHHLFPNICHVHYPKISKIVSETAREYNIPYYEGKSLVATIYDHGKFLNSLGKKEYSIA